MPQRDRSMSSASSSSGFLTDEEEVGHEINHTTVVVEVIEEEEILDASQLLNSIRDELSPELVQCLEPLVVPNPKFYSYDTYTTVLYNLSTQWPTQHEFYRHPTIRNQIRTHLLQQFATAFPLTPEWYREWIDSTSSIQMKHRLYQQAQCDYWSVSLALDHWQWLQGMYFVFRYPILIH